jgi:hypothetical protein
MIVMVDPASITAITGLVLQGLDLVQKRREGKLTKEDAQTLYSKIYSSLLWEIHQNLGRCKMIYKNAEEKRQISAGVLSFFVRDALFSDFCVMCPEPSVISQFNSIYGAFERVHHWQRTVSDLKSENAGFIIAFARSMFLDAHIENVYNLLRETLEKIAPTIDKPPIFVINEGT